MVETEAFPVVGTYMAAAHRSGAALFRQRSSVNPLDSIETGHLPEDSTEWNQGPPPERSKKKFEESRDTGSQYPL